MTLSDVKDNHGTLQSDWTMAMSMLFHRLEKNNVLNTFSIFRRTLTKTFCPLMMRLSPDDEDKKECK